MPHPQNPTNENPGIVAAPIQPSLPSLIVLVFIMVVLHVGSRDIVFSWALTPLALKLSIICHQLVSILLPTILFVIILRLPPRMALGLWRPSWKRFALALVFGVIVMSMVLFFLPLVISPSRELTEQTSFAGGYTGLQEFLITFLAVSIVAPVADELFFRGVLLRGLVVRYGGIAAVLATAILTALFHTLEPFKLVHAFAMGVIFATSVLWTRSVYTSIILHGLHNTLSLIPQG